MNILLTFFRYALLILFSLICIGFVFERLSRFYLNRNRPSLDHYVNSDGRDLHFYKKGKGAKTIIFESGQGSDHLHWTQIQNELSNQYVTLSYDRAGILWSDYCPEISLKRIESDLSSILESGFFPKPYIFVAHSFGGITSRKFIDKHRSDISGVVFIDVTHPRQIEETSSELKKLIKPPSWRFVSFVNEIGLIRLLYSIQPFTKVVSKDHFFNRNVANYFYKVLPGLKQEVINDQRLMKEAESIDDFGDIPLRIVTASYPDGVERIPDQKLAEEYIQTHQKLQKDLLQLSSQSEQIMADSSGHYITLQQPELIVDIIKRL